MNQSIGETRRNLRFGALVTVFASLIAFFAVAGSAGAARPVDLVVKEPTAPLLKFVRAKKSTRFTTGNLHQEPFLKAVGRPLELWAHRLEPGGEAIVEQVDRSSGKPVATAVPGLEASMDRGLESFVKYRITNGRGDVVAEADAPLCPNAGNDFYGSAWSRSSGVDRGRNGPIRLLPGWWGEIFACGEQQADSLVWVLGKKSALSYGGSAPFALPDGRYTYRATVNPYGALPERSSKNNTFVRHFTLRTNPRFFKRKRSKGGPAASASGVATQSLRRSKNFRPKVAPPNASQIEGPDGALPDPMALPASRFGFFRQGSRDRISFSSIVSNAGKAPIVLYGQRSQKSSRTMPGWQYTKDANGKVVRKDTNGFVWDQRDTHLHWHYNRLAVYELLDLDGNVLRRSDKIGFCFMPTTLLSFTPAPGADPIAAPSWYDDRRRIIDCGFRRSLRVAMSLPAGWGDEYYQGIAGQSLDVTTLPAGSYRLRITVNPLGDLAESDPNNNVSERMIQLGGKGASRTLTVPRQGIVSPEFYKIQRESSGRGGSGFISSAGAASTVAGGRAAITGGAPRYFCGLR